MTIDREALIAKLEANAHTVGEANGRPLRVVIIDVAQQIIRAEPEQHSEEIYGFDDPHTADSCHALNSEFLEALQDIYDHSVYPFTGEKWNRYARDVAGKAIAKAQSKGAQ